MRGVPRLLCCATMSQAPGVVFVAGATGYTGRAVVRRAVREGVRTVAHVRPGSSSLDRVTAEFTQWGAEVEVTPWEPDAMRESLARIEPTVIFSLLGTTANRAKREGMQATEGYERIDYGLSVLLMDAAVASESRARFVYLSAIGVSESSHNPYMAVRWRAEQHLRATGLPFTIVRPSFISGSDREESRPMERLGATVGDGLLAVVGALGARKLRDRYASLDADGLARGMFRVATDPEFEGRIAHPEDLR